MSHIYTFSNILKKPGLLSNLLLEHFDSSRSLYEDIVENYLEKEFKNGKLKEIYQACRENYPNTDKVRTMFRYSNLKVINRITILQGEYGQYKVSKNGIETILTSEKNNTKLQDEKDIELWIKKEINRLANMKLELMDVLEVANE